jgi:alpha-glucoside transport system permease protein
MPMAISFVGAAVIWKLIYDYPRRGQRPDRPPQRALSAWFDGGVGSIIGLRHSCPGCLVGLLILSLAYVAWAHRAPSIESRGQGARPGAGRSDDRCRRPARSHLALVAGWLTGVFAADLPYGQPQVWLQMPFWNNFFLMVGAGLDPDRLCHGDPVGRPARRARGNHRGRDPRRRQPVPDLLRIKVPQIMGTIVVVWTTITITVLKVFDIVLAMTNGQWETQVLANYMYDKLFRSLRLGRGIGLGHGDHGHGDADPCLERHQNARREMR